MKKIRELLKRNLHAMIYINFILGIIYAGYRVFTTSRTEFILRRLYAIEAWLIIGFTAVYFALTDFKTR